ncbi:fungal specific transcription factor domain-containing protein [Colletotrichum gloeosporioides Cg-14]|uniref:Fungal specific transcription factor domain-containing protein n=1 Tax=Colletotrichum gloeosporioides (strain Cg-14) TaxID=1237896 RepID=T0L418_COLGC|nr:fungal specific transcription factor domain-containing protein [Colletotrichum gloeosporioides Cg-14]
MRPQQTGTSSVLDNHNTSTANITAAYELAANAARESEPLESMKKDHQHKLPYSRAFFLGAELPFPLAFQEQRAVNIPTHDGNSFTRLPEEVANQLVIVYVDRILPHYPLFSRQEMLEMFQRFKESNNDQAEVKSEEQFTICMVMAIATLSSKARDYRKLVSVAESLRSDAFARLDWEQSLTGATTTTIQQLLLIAQYGFLFPASTNLWQVVGDAARVALGLGLHQDTTSECGMTEAILDYRKRLYWTPLAPHSKLGFDDTLKFLRLQSEICSVNIGMRPISDSNISYEDWLVDIERRVREIKAGVVSTSMSQSMEWHTMLILHMPCARNPNPAEASVLKYFRAAVCTVRGYWELIVSNDLDDPWHATHRYYEAGNLILYALWHYRSLIRRNHTIAQIFEVVHQISSIFILLAKQWPAAQQCGILFDRLRKGPLSFFRDDNSSDSSLGVEARQLKELVFRENADVLYAREQPVDTSAHPTLDAIFPDFGADSLSFDNSADILEFFNLFNDSTIECFDATAIDLEDTQLGVSQQPAPSLRPTSILSDQLPASMVDRARLRNAMEKLPICSHCKRRRIKCDTDIPACRNCTKLRKDCCYWDNALGEETSRKHLHALIQHAERLIDETEELSRSPESGNIAPDDPMVQNNAQISCSQSSSPSSILFQNPSGANNSSDTVFFGATSSFVRLANVIQGSVSLPTASDATTSVPQVARLYESVCGSLTVDITGTMPFSEAQNLTSLYYRSIEITYPILGQELISQILDQVYNGSSATTEYENLAQIRLHFMLAISLALLSPVDPRLQMFADAYFGKAMSCGTSIDLFIHPTNQSLQTTLLLCIYAWLCPSAIDLWRVLGHASRMYLDIIEVHGSGQTEPGDTDMLYRTLYSLETQTAIAFGRPSQLPDVKTLSVRSPDWLSTAVGDMDLPSMVYHLARLKSRFHRDMIGKHGTSSGHSLSVSRATDCSWMSSYIHEIRIWIDKWNTQVDALFMGSFAPHDYAGLQQYFRACGTFQQCEALLLAKAAADGHHQSFVSKDEEILSCIELLRAAGSLLRSSTPASSQADFVFNLTWTRAHSLFIAAVVVLQHTRNGMDMGPDVQSLICEHIEMLCPDRISGRGTIGLAKCLQTLNESIQLSPKE